MEKQYGIIFDMLNKSGFGWDDVLKCVQVDSDEVWQAYVQVCVINQYNCISHAYT